MTEFNRNVSTIWRNEVPGARWFRSDLHIHTLDDHPAPNFKFPAEIGNIPQESSTQEAYARAFLQTAILNGIEVLGLTPHSVRSGDTDETSATWRIVEVWNKDNDDDGVPFRDKIYAVFPGFEPNLADGDEGLHLSFLFDPEIGRDSYIRAFNAVMGALTPWDGQALRISPNKASDVFAILDDLHKREGENWDYLVLAPHAFGNRGLFSLKSEILQWFPHENICGLELKDSWLPEDAHSDKPWLADGMKKYNHALYHSSDAYKLSDIGSRFTLIKLASSRIEALRQAFLASDSRMRIACCKDHSNEIVISSDLPEPCPGSRPWLKEVSIKGGTSFFGGQNTSTESPREQIFQLNPDLNCLIGGRMSGKSTFIDGIRVMFDYDLPKDDVVRQDVQDRASKRFLSGNAEVSVKIHGPHNPASPVKERWPATFYAQRELQKAVRDQETRRQILYRLIPAETVGLLERDEKLHQLDQGLLQLLKEIETCRTAFEEAVQDFQHVEASKEALERFKDAGIDKLIEAQADRGRIEVIQEVLSGVDETISTLESEADQISVNSITGSKLKQTLDGEDGEPTYQELFQKYNDTINDLKKISSDIQKRLATAKAVSESHMTTVRDNVQEEVIKAGGKAEDINQFDALATSVADYEKVLTRRNRVRTEYYKALRKFATTRLERFEVMRQQREAMQRVAEIVKKRFPDRIRVHIQQDGLSDSLEQWISSLRESGITRWWNNQKGTSPIPISPELIRQSFKRKILFLVGMSHPVATTFRGLMSSERQLQLVSLRNEDRYFIRNYSAYFMLILPST